MLHFVQAHFAQTRPPIPVLSSGVPGFHPGGPRLPPQQMYYGQGAHGFPPQPAYGFQQQLLPGIRPGVGPNYILPYPLQRQGQPGQRIGPRRGGSSQQMQQQQQVLFPKLSNYHLVKLLLCSEEVFGLFYVSLLMVYVKCALL